MKTGENIYKRKDGRWEGRYIKGRKNNGKIHYGYVYGTSKQAVREKLYPLKERYQGIRFTYGETVLRFKEWGLIWLESIKDNVKKSTYAGYYYKLKKYVFSEIGEIALNELNAVIGQKLVTKLKANLTASSIQIVFQIIHSCLKKAVERDLLRSNPFKKVELPRVRRKKVRSLSKGEQKRLEQVAYQAGDKGLPTLIALYSGLRIGELAALRWQDIDFTSNTIQISHTLQRISDPFNEGKTEIVMQSSKTETSVRIIPISQKYRQRLLRLKKKSASEFVFATGKKPCEPKLLSYYFAKLVEQAHLSKVHFHQLRHTFATRSLENNCDISSVSAILGHVSTRTTLDVYADAQIEQRIKVIAVLDNVAL